MRCEKAKRLIVDYVYHELSEKQRKKLEEHIAHCWGCSFELESFQKTITLVESQTKMEVDEQFLEVRWREIENRFPQSKAALKNRTLFGQVRDWILDRFPSPGWLFHEFIMRKTLPALGVFTFVISASLFIIHTLRTKQGGQDVPFTPAEQVTMATPEGGKRMGEWEEKESGRVRLLPNLTEGETPAKPVRESNAESVREGEAPAEPDTKITINFYLKEHENAVTQISYSSQPKHQEIELGREDMFYYDTVRGLGREQQGEAGVFLRAPRRSSYPTPKEPSMLLRAKRSNLATNIANSHKLSLREAQEAVNFKIVAPQTLYPAYLLETIRKIDGTECIHLIYTDGISTLSLFEQAVESEEKLHSSDFREYVMYSKDGDEPVNIIGWNSAEVSFTLIGKEDLSQLMSIIRAIQSLP
jgi:hypothetical protein